MDFRFLLVFGLVFEPVRTGVQHVFHPGDQFFLGQGLAQGGQGKGHFLLIHILGLLQGVAVVPVEIEGFLESPVYGSFEPVRALGLGIRYLIGGLRLRVGVALGFRLEPGHEFGPLEGLIVIFLFQGIFQNHGAEHIDVFPGMVGKHFLAVLVAAAYGGNVFARFPKLSDAHAVRQGLPHFIHHLGGSHEVLGFLLEERVPGFRVERVGLEHGPHGGLREFLGERGGRGGRLFGGAGGRQFVNVHGESAVDELFIVDIHGQGQSGLVFRIAGARCVGIPEVPEPRGGFQGVHALPHTQPAAVAGEMGGHQIAVAGLPGGGGGNAARNLGIAGYKGHGAAHAAFMELAFIGFPGPFRIRVKAEQDGRFLVVIRPVGAV